MSGQARWTAWTRCVTSPHRYPRWPTWLPLHPVPTWTGCGTSSTLPSAVHGNLTILRAASKFPHITHVLLTSSMAAVQSMQDSFTSSSKTLTPDDDWNSARTEDEANKLNAFAAYFASKTESERAAWSYIKQTPPHYTLATFCPPFIFDLAGTKANKRADVSSSLGLFYDLMKGTSSPGSLNGDFVDARDIAQAFRLAIEKPLQDNQRFLLCAGAVTPEEVESFAKTLDPAVLQERPMVMDSSKARQLLGWKPRSKRDTFVDMAAYLQEQDKGMSK